MTGPTFEASGSAVAAHLPKAPSAAMMWSMVLLVASVALGLFMLDQIANLLLNKWLLESMGYGEVFWTNFSMQAALFVSCLILSMLAIGLPGMLHGLSRRGRINMIWISILGGVFIGYVLSLEFYDFIGPITAVPFNEADPIFGNDISFYVFDLPPIVTSLVMALVISAAGLISSIWTALAGSRDAPWPEGMNAFVRWLGRIGTPFTCIMLVATGTIAASLIWLRRYDLLTMPNFEDSTEGTGAGAEYVDIVGFFSTKNSIYVEALAVLALTIGLTLTLIKARRALTNPGSVDLKRAFSAGAFALVLLPGITIDLTFRSIVALRDQLFVVPNEPVIQLPYLERHIEATNKAFGLDKVEETTYVPPGPDAPLPDLASMLESPTIKNAPLWTGTVSRYSRRVAPQYVQRILLAEGNMTIYAPTLEIFEAQETLRPYYGFMDVDTIVAQDGDELTMFASAVRELPQDRMRPWLVAWGQRSFVFTHGHGLITVWSGKRSEAGDPIYGTSGVPVTTNFAPLGSDNHRIYYGEGAINAAFSNARGIDEHDVATEQGRSEYKYPSDVEAGFKVDSLLKRLVVGYETGQFFNIVFSDLIADDTRVHIYRRPIERIEQLAPFIAVDTDPYAVPTREGIKWFVNAVTYSDRYPYSAITTFGDPADLRTEWRPLEPMNYIRDSVKVVIDAATGHVDFYQFDDEPVIQTWVAAYPSLFKKKEEMSPELRSYVQYPQELMGIQFNMIYPFYHQREPLTFYAGEDLIDDADEVLGPIMGESGATITFSQDLFYWIAETGDVLPAADPPVQFALSKTYTPQDPLNLRALVTAYQTGDDYGRLSVVKIPKGVFFMGPEQADAAIDQDSFIAQQIGLWNRLGVEVIRGRTSTLLLRGEVVYVEPIFIRSRQNPVPQLQRVIVVLRGKPHMGRTIEEALTFAIEGGRLEGTEADITAALGE